MNLISDHDDYRSGPGTLLTSQIAETAREDDPSATVNSFSRFLSNESSSEFRRGDAGVEKEEFRSMMYGATLGAGGNRTAFGGGLGVDAGSVETNGGILLRHSSSPAGLFAHMTADDGLSTMKNVDGFRIGTASNCDKPMASRLKQQANFPSLASSNRSLSRIPELGGERSGASGSDGGSFLNGFPVGSWDDSHLMPESFSHLQNPDLLGRKLDGTRIPGFAASHVQNGEPLSRGPSLSHQFSLPKTSSEMAAVEKFFGQMHGTVPCRVRAKRGCATHPRSIAERVRRTRISERMRKLQELVPNMDKQTNTADMLELAVDYIKDLRQKVQELSDSRSRCTCGSKHRTY